MNSRRTICLHHSCIYYLYSTVEIEMDPRLCLSAAGVAKNVAQFFAAEN